MTPETWVFVGRLAVIAVVGLGLRLLLDRWEARRALAEGQLRTEIDRTRRVQEIELARQDLLLPFGCGCCGQDCPDGELWCYACRAHVGDAAEVCDRTYFAQHGVDCPYQVRPIEETRLMPGADPGDENDHRDQVAEGLGMMRREPEYLGRRWVVSPRRIELAAPSHVHGSAPIDASLQRALDEIAREPHA